MRKENLTVSKEDLNGADKRRILENFVENDNALSLLLDFISSKHASVYDHAAAGNTLRYHKTCHISDIMCLKLNK